MRASSSLPPGCPCRRPPGGGDPAHHRIVLSSVYRDATERAFDRRLNLYSPHPHRGSRNPDEPPDHQRSRSASAVRPPLAGWYCRSPAPIPKSRTCAPAFAAGQEAAEILEDNGADLTAAGIRLGYVEGPEGQNLRMVERPVDLGADARHLAAWPATPASIFDETRTFDYLGGTFAALSIEQALTTIFRVRFARAAEAHFGIDRRYIRSGRAERLEGEFPVENAPLARETNALLDANRNRRARAHPCRKSRARYQDAVVGHRE